MKKKILLVSAILIIFLLGVFAAGCNEVKTGEDYYRYTYDSTQGQFVQNNAKITFEKTDYYMYNNNGQVINVGTHTTNNNTISLIPDLIGNASQIAATTSMFVSDEYIIDPTSVFSRVAETQFEDRAELEGIYDNNLKLSDGKIFESIDGSNTDESFTDNIGDYKINKKKDFITFNLNNGTVFILLRFEYTDAFGYNVNGLATSFYSYKEPKTDDIAISDVELADKIFLNKSTGGGSANYNLSLLTYPKKEIVTEGITYSIVGVNNNASITGSELSYNGTGSVQIEYKYGNITGTEWVYIVDIDIITNITDAQRTYNVGDIEDFDDILSDLTIYDSYWFTYESVEISDETKAEISNGAVEFKAIGTVEATLRARYVLTYKDGTSQVIEKVVTINLIIEA